MKRIISATMVLLLILSGSMFISSAEDAPFWLSDKLYGDANNNRSIDIFDVTFIQKFLVGLQTFNRGNTVLSDVDDDGEVSVLDAIMIQKKLARIVDKFPADDSTANNNSAYNFKTDYQYYYHGLLGGGLPIAKSETGYYFFLPTRFLYYLDKESLEATPLCNKVNCLHDDRDECDAFFNTYLVPSDLGGSFNIQYYDDSLYMLLRDEDENGNFFGTSFYKVSLDGVTREKLISFDHGLSAWLVHRGYFYYTVEKYSDEIDLFNVFDSFSIKRLPLDDFDAEPTGIFNSKDYCDNVNSTNRLIAYDDYVYTSANPISKETLEEYKETGKWIVSSSDHIFSINTKDLTVNQLTNPDGEVNTTNFYNGKLLYSIGNSDENSKLRYYTSELDGSNPVFLKEMELGDYLFCNENQSYLENSWKNLVNEVSVDYEELKMLDHDLNVISSFKVPFKYAIGNIAQDSDYFIVFQSIGNSDTEVYCIEKSKLDKMNGEEVEYKTVYSSLKNRPQSEE